MDFLDDIIRTFKSNLGNELWDLSEARPSIEGSNSKLVRFSRFLGLSTEGHKKIGGTKSEDGQGHGQKDGTVFKNRKEALEAWIYGIMKEGGNEYVAGFSCSGLMKVIILSFNVDRINKKEKRKVINPK